MGKTRLPWLVWKKKRNCFTYFSFFQTSQGSLVFPIGLRLPDEAPRQISGSLNFGEPQFRGASISGNLDFGEPRFRGTSISGILDFGDPRPRLWAREVYSTPPTGKRDVVVSEKIVSKNLVQKLVSKKPEILMSNSVISCTNFAAPLLFSVFSALQRRRVFLSLPWVFAPRAAPAPPITMLPKDAKPQRSLVVTL